MNIKAIFFDFDGTIVNSEIFYFKCWNKTLKEFEIQLSEEDFFINYSGVPTQENASRIVGKYLLPISSLELARKREQIEFQNKSKQSFQMMPYAEEVIKTCHKNGIQLGIVTNSKMSELDLFFTKEPYKHFFDFFITHENFIFSKPNPESYILAIKKAKCDISEIIVFEDSKTGVQAAVSAGLKCMAIQNNVKLHKGLTQAFKIFYNFKDAITFVNKNCQWNV